MRANCVNVIFIKVLFMEFIKSEPVIQFGNSSVEIRWVIQDGKVLHCFSSRSYHWLYGTVSWWDYYYFFQVNFSLHSFVISYEHRLQPGLNFIQDEAFWVCNFTFTEIRFWVCFYVWVFRTFFRKLTYILIFGIIGSSVMQSARPHYCARSSGPSEFLAIRLGYATEMYWPRRHGKTLNIGTYLSTYLCSWSQQLIFSDPSEAVIRMQKERGICSVTKTSD